MCLIWIGRNEGSNLEREDMEPVKKPASKSRTAWMGVATSLLAIVPLLATPEMQSALVVLLGQQYRERILAVCIVLGALQSWYARQGAIAEAERMDTQVEEKVEEKIEEVSQDASRTGNMG